MSENFFGFAPLDLGSKKEIKNYSYFGEKVSILPVKIWLCEDIVIYRERDAKMRWKEAFPFNYCSFFLFL